LPALLVWHARSAGARIRTYANEVVRWMRSLRLRIRPTQTVSGLVLRPPTSGSRFVGPVGAQRRPSAEGNFTSTSTKSKCRRCPRAGAQTAQRPPKKLDSRLAPAGHGRRRRRLHWGQDCPLQSILRRCCKPTGTASGATGSGTEVTASNISADPSGGSATSTNPSMCSPVRVISVATGM
jgi:hypothetical protein